MDQQPEPGAPLTVDQLNWLRATIAHEMGARERALVDRADKLALLIGEVLDSPVLDDGRTSVRPEHIAALRAAFEAPLP